MRRFSLNPMVGHEQAIRACGVDSRDTCWEPIIQPQVPIRWTSSKRESYCGCFMRNWKPMWQTSSSCGIPWSWLWHAPPIEARRGPAVSWSRGVEVDDVPVAAGVCLNMCRRYLCNRRHLCNQRRAKLAIFPSANTCRIRLESWRHHFAGNWSFSLVKPVRLKV